jgi:hypothetical protein
MLARYRGKTLCPKCHGTRLKPEAGYVRVGGKNISELVDLPITELKEFFDHLELDEHDNNVSRRILVEIKYSFFMVVGKVSEFIGSLYYLCVTLLRFKNIMKLKNYLLLLALLLVVGVRAQVPSGNKYPKREFRGAWIQAVNGQFRGIPTERLKQILISQLNSLQEAGINAIIFQVRPEADALYASQHEPWSRFLTGTQGQTPSPMWEI